MKVAISDSVSRSITTASKASSLGIGASRTKKLNEKTKIDTLIMPTIDEISEMDSKDSLFDA